MEIGTCCICHEVCPDGGTRTLVLNEGQTWLEFCLHGGKTSTLTNQRTKEVVTLYDLYNRTEKGGTA